MSKKPKATPKSKKFVMNIPSVTTSASPPNETKDPLKDGVDFREKLRREWNKGVNERNMNLVVTYLEEAKLKLIQLKYLEQEGHLMPQGDIILARDILEIGVLYSIFQDEPDIEMFERYMSQLKPYYFEYGENIPVSAHKYEMLGANLLCLLTEGRLAEFHTELARMLYPGEKADEIMQDVYIKRAVELERALEEGRYGLVHAQDGAQKKSGLWRYFVDKLAKSTRLKMADTIESAYEKFSQTMLMEKLKFTNTEELRTFANKREWKMYDDGFYYFNQGDMDNKWIPAQRLLKESLAYARELEIII